MKSEWLVFAGIGLIVVGVLLLVAGGLLGALTDADADVRGGGVVMIGPIPIVFGSDRNMAMLAVGVTLLMVLGLLLFLRRQPL